MGFGGLYPAPHRLGGNTREGWRAEQHARACADLVALQRVMPLCVFSLRCDPAAFTASLVTYLGRNGQGADIAGANALQVSWNTETDRLAITLRPYVDELGKLHNWRLQSPICRAAPGGNVPIVSVDAPSNTVTLDMAGFIATTRLVFVFRGTDRQARIEDYGGSLDKKNSKTEGEAPYSHGFLLDLETSRGSAYRTDGLLGVENRAYARFFQFLQRVLEQYAAGAVPATASGYRLQQWARWLGVYSTGLEDWELLNRCAAHAMLRSGSLDSVLQLICQKVLGNAFVRIDRAPDDDWDSPWLPVPTYWDGNQGAGDLDLGEGTWMSIRSHIKVVVRLVPGMTLEQLSSLCERVLAPLLDVALCGVATYSWGREGGFVLGASRLGFDTF